MGEGTQMKDHTEDGNKERFVSYLKENGLSCSTKRLILFDLIYSLHLHFSAEELLDLANKKKLGISRAAIFRNLTTMEEGGFIRRVQFTDRHAHFEHTLGHIHHEHLICIRCQKIVDFHKSSLEHTFDEIAADHGFKPISHELEIRGICKDCF